MRQVLNTVPAKVALPSGHIHLVDRGAGQGEADGPLKAALAIGMAVMKWRHHLRTHHPDIAVYDSWYIDDGQIVCAPQHVPYILRALDTELHAIGSRRAQHPQDPRTAIKTTVRLFGPNLQDNTTALQQNTYTFDSTIIQDGTKDSTKLMGGPWDRNNTPNKNSCAG